MSPDPFAEPFEPDHTTVVDRRGSEVVVRKTGRSPAARHRLAHEAAVLAQSRRPGVVELVDHHDDGAETTLVTTWVGTHTLATAPVRSVEQVAGLVAAVADTVEALHVAGIVHGRLTPDHVALDERGYPVLIGFGEASLDTHPTRRHDRPDDRAALGRLLEGLLDALPDGPASEHGRRADRKGRAALAALVRDTTVEDRWARPSAHRLGTAILEAVPGARPLAPATGSGADPEPAPHPGAPFDRPVPSAPPTIGFERSIGPVPPARPGTAPGGPGTAAVATTDPPDPPSTATPLPLPSAAPGGHTVQLGAMDRPARAARPDPTSPTGDGTHRRRRWMVLAAVVAVVVAAGATGLALGRTDPPPGPQPHPTAAPPTTAVPLPTTIPATTAAPPSVPVAPDRLTTVETSGVVVHEGRRYKIGDPGDETSVADFRCTGAAIPVTLRPDTGEIWAFDDWTTETGVRLDARVVTRVDPGSHLVPSPVDDGGCATLTVRRPDGSLHGVVLPVEQNPGQPRPAATGPPADRPGARS